MTDIIIDTYKLNRYAQRLASVNSRIGTLDYRLDTLYMRVGLVDLFKLIQADALTHYSWRLVRCKNYLQQTAIDFEAIEMVLQNQDPSNFNPHFASVWINNLQSQNGYWNQNQIDIQRIIRAGIESIGQGVSESALIHTTRDIWNAFWSGNLKIGEDDEEGIYYDILTTEYFISAIPEYAMYKDEEMLGDKDHLNINIEQKKYSSDKMQVNSDESWYDNKNTIFQTKIEERLEASVADAKVSGSRDWGEGSAEVKFVTGEVHSEFDAGIYVYTKDKDGNVKKIFSPGVSAEAGVSIALVQAEAEGRIGIGEDNNMLGLYGKVDAELLEGEAKLKVAINRNEVYAGASAEANIAKVSANGGVSVLGTDIGLSGSLKVGAGAHAEFGFTDGKVKVDIGAALGVGFDLGFEVDVSGTVDAVCDFASSVVDWIF